MIPVTSTPVRGAAAQTTQTTGADPHYELRFAGLVDAGRGCAFPCDAHGIVDLDSLGGRARINYFYARTVIGREFFAPVTRLVSQDAMA